MIGGQSACAQHGSLQLSRLCLKGGAGRAMPGPLERKRRRARIFTGEMLYSSPLPRRRNAASTAERHCNITSSGGWAASMIAMRSGSSAASAR